MEQSQLHHFEMEESPDQEYPVQDAYEDGQFIDVEMRETRPRTNTGFQPHLSKRPRQDQNHEPVPGRPTNSQGFQIRNPPANTPPTNPGATSVPPQNRPVIEPNQPPPPQPAAPANRVRQTQTQMPPIQRRMTRANYDVMDQLQGTAAKISYAELFKQAPAIRRKLLDTLQHWDDHPTAQTNLVTSGEPTPSALAAISPQPQIFPDDISPIVYPGNHIGVLKASVGINGQKISAIVDSGATHCMLSDVLAKKLLIFNKLRPTNKTFRTASGQSTRPLGVIYDQDVNLGSTCLPVDIYITKATNFTMLLANAFLGPAGVTIDFGNKCIRCRLGPDIWESIPMDFQSMGRERQPGTTIMEPTNEGPTEEQQLYIEEEAKPLDSVPPLPTSSLRQPAIIQIPPQGSGKLDNESEVFDNSSEDINASSLNSEILDSDSDCLSNDGDSDDFDDSDLSQDFQKELHPCNFRDVSPNQTILPVPIFPTSKEDSVYSQALSTSTWTTALRHTQCLPASPMIDLARAWDLDQAIPNQFLAYTAALVKDKDDWMLDRDIFQRLDKKFGPHDVDACANTDGANSQISTWYWTKERSCLHQNWADFNIWCHPPWHLIDKVIDRYVEFIDTCQVTLVVPNWTWAPWYPKLLQYFDLVDFYQTGSEVFTTTSSDSLAPRQRIEGIRWQIFICRGRSSDQIEDGLRNWCFPYQPKTPMTTDLLFDHNLGQISIGRKDDSQLTPQQEATARSVLAAFRDIIAWTEADIGQTFIHAPPINTGDVQPLKQRPYRNSRHEDLVIEIQVLTWLEQGVIERSASPWSSPVVLVPKKALDPDNPLEEKRYRMCIDYRKLNALTKPDSFPLPNMQDALDSLGQSRVFSIIDLRSAFLQLPLQLADKEKTAFTVKSGLYHFNTLPFGLKNSPSVFQRLMHRVLGDLMYHICMVYLDDIIVYSPTFEEHMEDLTTVLNRLRKFNLKIHPEKTILATDQVTYLGHLCSAASIAPDPYKLSAVRTIKPPTSVTEVRSFLGLVGYYRRFVKDFASIAQPLHSLLHKDITWTWTEHHQLAFDNLKQRLLGAPILAQPDFSKTFILQTDWSTLGIGAVLTQKNEQNKEQPVSYYSRSLTPAEQNYSASEGEALAVISAISHFRPYLHGRRFFLQTDHIALKWLMTTTNLKGKLARWALELQEYDFDITYRKGAANGNADALSRLAAATIIPFPDDEPALFYIEESSSSDNPDLKEPTNEDIGPSRETKEPVSAEAGQDNTLENKTHEVSPTMPKQTLTNMSLQDFNDHLVRFERAKAYVESMQPTLKAAQEKSLRRGVSLALSSSPSYEDLECEICGDQDLAEEMLICDACDKGFHIGCLNPPLEELPSEDKWTCKKCVRATKLDVTEDIDMLYFLRTGDHTPGLDLHNKKRVTSRAKRYYEENGKLYFNENAKFGTRPVPPVDDRNDIIRSLHELGHYAVRRTANLVQERYYWPGIFEDTNTLIRNCQECTMRNIKYLEKPQLKSIPINDQAFYRVGLDLVGPFTVTNRGNRYLVVAVDFLTKWPEVAALTNKKAETIAAFFEDNIIARHGCPREVLTDNGTEFRGSC